MESAIRSPLLLKYEFADSIGALDAYEAARALLGASRALAISTNLFVNDEVISKAPSLKRAKIELRPIRSGILEFPIDILIPTVAGIRDSIYAAIFWDYTKYIFSRTLGKKEPNIKSEAKSVLDRQGGAVDAAVDRISAAMLEAHRPIGRGAKHAIFVNGDNNNITIIDSTSQEFLEHEIFDEKTINFEGTISSFNANTNIGGIFIPSEERVVRFNANYEEIFTDNSRAAIAESLVSYVARNPKTVRMRGHAIRTRTGDLKRIHAISVRLV